MATIISDETRAQFVKFQADLEAVKPLGTDHSAYTLIVKAMGELTQKFPALLTDSVNAAWSTDADGAAAYVKVQATIARIAASVGLKQDNIEIADDGTLTVVAKRRASAGNGSANNDGLPTLTEARFAEHNGKWFMFTMGVGEKVNAYTLSSDGATMVAKLAGSPFANGTAAMANAAKNAGVVAEVGKWANGYNGLRKATHWSDEARQGNLLKAFASLTAEKEEKAK